MKAFSCFFLSFSLCFYAQEYEILQHEKPIKIVPLPQLNTSSRECNLSLLPNGKSLFFMSTRAMRGGAIGNGDIYQSEFVDGTWQAPIPLKNINTASGEDEPTFSQDGSEMYFQSWDGNWKSMGGPYYHAEKRSGEWVKTGSMGENINRFFATESSANFGYGTDGMAVSADGKLFIVACGANYNGPMDLFFSVKTKDGWSYPKIMGVSTDGDERSVFIAADNRTIYFSSDGMGGFGGLDIFKVQIDKNGKLGEPVNIGAPFNTAEDDMGFVASADGKSAFFIRNLDIYFADISELSEKIKPIETQKTNQPVEIPTPKNPEESKNTEKIILYFDSDVSTLNSTEMNKLSACPKTGKMVVHGYCDSDGSDAYNQKLADARCESVLNALIGLGINSASVRKVVHGEKSPAVSNKTETGKAKNRRAVLEIFP